MIVFICDTCREQRNFGDKRTVTVVKETDEGEKPCGRPVDSCVMCLRTGLHVTNGNVTKMEDERR